VAAIDLGQEGDGLRIGCRVQTIVGGSSLQGGLFPIVASLQSGVC
jgi:hypothetical protein